MKRGKMYQAAAADCMTFVRLILRAGEELLLKETVKRDFTARLVDRPAVVAHGESPEEAVSRLYQVSTHIPRRDETGGKQCQQQPKEKRRL